MLIDEVIHIAQQRTETHWFVNILKKAVVVKIQNVADYVFESPPEKWDIERDFPNIAPPFGIVWFEWMHNAGWGFSGPRPDYVPNRFRIGALFLSCEAQDVMSAPSREWIEKATPDMRWFTFGNYFWDAGQGVEAPSNLGWGVSGDGQIRTFDGNLILGKSPLDGSTAELSTRDIEDGSDLQILFPIPFMALSFMHCKNVQVIQGPAWPPRLQMAREKRGKPPLVRWHTLVIDSVKTIIAAENSGNAALTPKSLHICRGHFKDFTQKGLFGMHHGVYWWPMQTRGSAQQGVVKKDYLVKAGSS